MSYRTVLMDPPWNERGGGRVKRGADRHYPLLKKHDIIRVIYQSGMWDPDSNSHLYMWVTNNYLKDGLFVMEALGYRYITNLCWAKDKIGLGQYFRGQHEICLFGVMGRGSTLVNDQPTLIVADRSKHSKKPIKTHRILERCSPGPRIEFFARQPRKGWVVWGNEV